MFDRNRRGKSFFTRVVEGAQNLKTDDRWIRIYRANHWFVFISQRSPSFATRSNSTEDEPIAFGLPRTLAHFDVPNSRSQP